jgi:hypothetical protein
LTKKRTKAALISDDVKREVERIVQEFNAKNSRRDDCYYEARFRGQYCYLYRADYGKLSPICRLSYTGKMDDWEFAIFKWSTETYDPNEWAFPGDDLVDGSIEGAMRAGLEAYSV